MRYFVRAVLRTNTLEDAFAAFMQEQEGQQKDQRTFAANKRQESWSLGALISEACKLCWQCET